MAFDNELRARAERTFDQRSLDQLSAHIVDPNLKNLARQYASGQVPAGHVVRQMEQSPAGLRGLDRQLKRYMSLPRAEIDAIKARHEQEINKIEAELTEQDRSAGRPSRASHRAIRGDDEELWEDHSWMR